ncbi:MAG: hypothetical protein Q8M07_13565 [Prosthecobacter sp.]|nr:hypothetical protein [Prosthecobacter sp.]
MSSEDYPTASNGDTSAPPIKAPSFSARSVAAVLMALPLCYNTLILLRVPKFQNMFMELLGSKDKLPTLALLILDHSMLLLATFWLLAVAAAAVIFFSQRVRKVWIAAGLSAFLLAVAGVIISLGLFVPLATLMRHTAGGGF